MYDEKAQKKEAAERLQILVDQGLSERVLSLYRDEGKICCTQIDTGGENETMLLSENPELQKIADEIAKDYEMTVYYAIYNSHPDPFFTMLTVLGVTPYEEDYPWSEEKQEITENKLILAYAYNFALHDVEGGFMSYRIEDDAIIRLT